MQDCIPALLAMLWPHNSSAAYLARHWACAIDVLEMVATLGDCRRLEVAGEIRRWDGRAWPIMGLLVQPVNNAVRDDLTGAVCSLNLRQAWGLAVRSERALRSVALHWSALEASRWGHLADNICLGATSLLSNFVERKTSAAWKAVATAASLLQLLTSNTATLLKVARYSGRMDGTVMRQGMLFFHDIILRSDLGPACQHAITVAGPTIFFLLAPRHIAYALHSAPSWHAACASNGGPTPMSVSSVSFWLHWMVAPCCELILDPRLSLLALTAQPLTALLHLVREEMEHSPEWVTPQGFAGTVEALYDYIEVAVERVHQLASRGCKGAASGSTQLRDLLAQPVLSLLGSTLLDQLAMLQHAPTTLTWAAQYHPRLIPPLNRPDDVEIAGCQVDNAHNTGWILIAEAANAIPMPNILQSIYSHFCVGGKDGSKLTVEHILLCHRPT